MSSLLWIGATALGFVVLVIRSLAVDEIRVRLQRHLRNNLEATIASLPQELQDEWAEEWRADLAAVIAAPLTALRFVSGVRRSALQLAKEPVPATATPTGRAAAPSAPRVGLVRKSVERRLQALWKAVDRFVEDLRVSRPKQIFVVIFAIGEAAVMRLTGTPSRSVELFLGIVAIGIIAIVSSNR